MNKKPYTSPTSKALPLQSVFLCASLPSGGDQETLDIGTGGDGGDSGSSSGSTSPETNPDGWWIGD